MCNESIAQFQNATHQMLQGQRAFDSLTPAQKVGWLLDEQAQKRDEEAEKVINDLKAMFK